ncbi:hypothetical protein BN946_scf185014.g63 [Trametes cinnabarina]|uniref:CCHC-type domain-containing protein n=1 Tax=Pycnoporus cinnabarinus TaxID=5643 RepID=A0A060SME0_PYCCI|nr:hypothetical protein BN946_scf185014.g63 [Trametes cinnabarina]
MSAAVKVLVVGSAVGQIRELFTKIKSIDEKHGKFDFALCVGDFFGPPKNANEEYREDHDVIQLLEGHLQAPMECYIMQGEHPLPAPVIEKFAKTGGILSSNVFLLHKSGVLNTAQGIRIASLGGIYESNLSANIMRAFKGFTSPYFTSQTVEKLLANTMTSSKPQERNYTSLAAIKSSTTPSQLVDILISNAWPAGITQFSSAPLPAPELASIGVEPVADIVRKTKPRYHFAAGGGHPPRFWEREPYVWEEDNARVSRFVSLGAFGGEQPSGKKQRVRVVLCRVYKGIRPPLTPTSEPPPRPSNATPNPFLQKVPKRPLDTGEDYRWGHNEQPGKRSRTEDPSGKPPPGYKCKICESPEAPSISSRTAQKGRNLEKGISVVSVTRSVSTTASGMSKLTPAIYQPGHFIRDCPVKNAVGDTGGKKPREGYVCRACGSELHYIQDCPVAKQTGPREGGGRRGPPKPIAPDECWFCLSNPNLAKHLIVSIGTECYVTLPKGQIIPTHQGANHPNVPPVPGGGHVLIVPITHYPTYLAIPPDLAEPIIEETEKYKSALREMFAKHGAVAVCFEVGRMSAKGGHAHVQVVPVPTKLKNAIEDAFREEGRSQGIEWEEDPDEALRACGGGRGSYFRVDLPDGRKMVHLIREHGPFSIQFGRQVLVSVLGMGDRYDWKACTQSEEEDKEDVQAFKTAFAPFDPSL